MDLLRRLPQAQRIVVAQLSGEAQRHAEGRGDGDPVAQLREISTDARLLGLAAAAYLVQSQAGERMAGEVLALLRAAGADEQVMAEHAEQVRRWTGEQRWRMAHWGR